MTSGFETRQFCSEMSQSRNPTDTQALLQSMLQRLKLQPGREGQAYLHAPVPVTAASTRGQDGVRAASNLQKVNTGPVNGFESGTNGVASNEVKISAVDGNFGLRGGEIQQPGHGCEEDRGLISSPTQKHNIDGGAGENRVLGQTTQPGISPRGAEQLFPSQSLKDAEITSFKGTGGERLSFGSSALTRNKDAETSVGQNQDQSFTPKVYTWSPKPTDTNPGTAGQEDKGLHVGNGGLGALTQSKDVLIVPTDQTAINSSFRRKQRSSENKTRRWTQKIKERWRDRPGSLGKKGKEDEGRAEQKSQQATQISPQNQPSTAETLISTSNKEDGRNLPSLDSSDPSKTPLRHTEDSINEANVRSTGDFEFGLGSFSLLDEIVTGQEWAKFLNPHQSATLSSQRPPEEPQIPPNPHDSSQPSVILNHRGGVNNQWSFRGTDVSPGSDFSMAQISPDAFQPVRMDVSEGKQQQYVHGEAEQSEPMEHGHIQSAMQCGDSGLGQRLRPPPSFVHPADVLNSSALRSRVPSNRKRQHQSSERIQIDKISDAREAEREGSLSSLSRTSSHAMEAAESQHDNIMPLYTLNSPPSLLSASSFSPFAPAPRGVLKHSISQDSESSMETMTKRRRVEENRRVHFSEEVQTIAPLELDLDATDSEEDSGAEEDSVTEQECAVEQAAIEEVAPARRPALPAWILALKRRNTGRKPR